MAHHLPSKPIISVCMPVFNGGPFLVPAIESILNQTFTQFELIICDNGSTDDSLIIARRLAERDSRISVYANQRGIGYGGNMHKSMSLARGDYILMHAADDLSAPHAFSKMMETIQNLGELPQGVILRADAYVIDEKGTATGVITKPNQGWDNQHVELAHYIGGRALNQESGIRVLHDVLERMRMMGFIGATLFSRSILLKIEGVYSAKNYNPDAELMYWLLSVDPQVVWLNEALFSWRLHSENHIAHDKRERRLIQAIESYHYTFSFPKSVLERAGIDDARLKKAFIRNYCVNRALSEIGMGESHSALRHLLFALATYPRQAIRDVRFSLAFLMAISGPFGRLSFRAARQALRYFNARKKS